MAIVIVDIEDRVRAFLPQLDELVSSGMLILDECEVIRYVGRDKKGERANWLLVIVGAMAGAPLGYLTDRTVQSQHDTVFPWGTFTVNVVGCFIPGLITGAVTSGGASSNVQLLLGTGLRGALTTYSTFSYETLRLAEDGARFFAAANVVGSIIAGLAPPGPPRHVHRCVGELRHPAPRR